MKRKKGIGLFALAAAAFLLGRMGDTVLVYLFPRMTLSRAVEEAAGQLWEEYVHSPVYVLSELLGENDGFTMGCTLSRWHPVMGDVQYKLKAAVQDKPRMIFADIILVFGERELDAFVYMDEEQAAFSSARLLKNAWYGFAFDKIGHDVRGNPVVSFFLGENRLRQLEYDLMSLKSWISQDFLKILPVHWEDIQHFDMGILMLDLDVQPDILAIDGKKQRVFKLSDEVSGAELSAAAASCGENIPGWAASFVKWMQQGEESVLELEFLMLDGKLFGVSACARAENGQYRAELVLDGENTAVSIYGREKNNSFSVSLGPERESSEYAQRIRISRTDSEGKKTVSCGCRWDAPTGNLWLSLTDGIRTGHAHVLVKQNSLRLEAAQLDPLLQILTGEGYGLEKCILTLTPEAQVRKVDYQDFPDWSLDDLFLLLEGFGSFLQTE